MKKILLLLFFMPASILLNAEEMTAYNETDEMSLVNDSVISGNVKKSAMARWWQNLIHGNIDRTFERKFDITFAGAPFYSQESSFGIGGSVNALYRVNKTDSVMQPSNFSIMGGISVKGTGMVGVQGNHHFTRDHRINYSIAFKHQVRDLWGFNFEDCYYNHVSNNNFMRVLLAADYQQRFSGSWFWGAALRGSYISCSPDSIHYLREDQKKNGFFVGVGPIIQYDSRDYILNPKRGMYFMFRYIYYPKILNTYKTDVSSATVQFNAYHKLWKGCIAAYDLFGEFNLSNGTVPWQLREEINVDDRRMRGYYTGRYIEDNQMCVQVELRQHIYKRLGAAAWGGVGTMFNKMSDIDKRHILPTFGGGLRFELKANTNLRVDIGFGRNNAAFMLGFGEAF